MKVKKAVATLTVFCILFTLWAGFAAWTGILSAAAEGGSAVTETVYGTEPVNLALHKPVTVSQPDAVFDAIQGIGPYAKETPLDRAGMLTDGKYGDVSNWSNTADWFVFYRKMKREVVVDLQSVNTVNRLSIGFGQRDDVGIIPPINVRYYVSNDGVDYRYLGKAEPDDPLYFSYTRSTNDMHRKTYKLDRLADGTPLNVQARYVKLVFVINIFGWADEIEIWGTPGIADGAVLPPSQPDNFEVNRYAAPGSAEAAEIRDQFLWYSGPMSEQNRALTDWTKGKVTAFLAYQDIYGNIKDWFFDDILAIPVVQMITPSGFDNNGAARYATKDDMLAFIDFIFQKDTQLGAINAAVADINRALKTNKKVRINVAIPMIEESSNFGDIYGDGSTLSTRPQDFASQVADPNSKDGRKEMARLALENKKAAVRWYIDEVERRFRAAGYDNLVLNSFYWYHERLYENTGEVDLIRATAEYLKSKGYHFTWIPYIGPSSAYTWKDLGFTTASIQPNFAFNMSKKAIFPAVADLARRVGGSLEIEYDDYRTLAQYLNYGVTEHYMTDAANTYYMAAAPIVDGAYAFAPLDPAKTPDSLSAIRRSVYDRVYEYVKDRYQRTYTMTLATNAADKSNIGVTVKLPLADSFMEGHFTVYYDASKVDFKRYDVPAALAGKGTFDVDSSRPGVLNIRFRIDRPEDAIFADLKTKRNPLDGAPDLITFSFAKKAGVADADITSRLFVAGKDGGMIDKNGAVYKNWGPTDIVPGSPEDELAGAVEAVRKAEVSRDKDDIHDAKFKVNHLPNSPVRDRLKDRLKAIK